MPTPGGRRNSNVVQSLMEPLAARAGWPEHLAKGISAKAHKFRASEQSERFKKAASKNPTAEFLARISSSDRTAVYLMRDPPREWYLKEGRRLKTTLRLGCHELNSRLGSVNRRGRPNRPTDCPFCPFIEDTVTHAWCECQKYQNERGRLYTVVQGVDPGFAALPVDEKVRFLLKDDLECKLDRPVYRFLNFLFDTHNTKLGDLTRPGLVSPP